MIGCDVIVVSSQASNQSDDFDDGLDDKYDLHERSLARIWPFGQ